MRAISTTSDILRGYLSVKLALRLQFGGDEASISPIASTRELGNLSFAS